MKHLKDYYHNRRKLKALKYESTKFKPRIRDIKKWFDILNEQIFGNKLPPFSKIRLIKEDGIYAFYCYWHKKKTKESELEMIKKFKTKKLFVEILAHEMIHHYQHLHNEPLGHGPSFTAWKENLKLRGLELHG